MLNTNRLPKATFTHLAKTQWARLRKAKLPMLFGVGVLMLGGGCAVHDAKPGGPPAGTWHVDYIEGAGVVDRSPARYRFDDNLRVSGNASCNSFTGTYQLVDGAIVMGNLASTRMMCPPALMEQERRFMAAMQRVHRWEDKNGLMYLYDKRDQELFRGALWTEVQQ